MAASIFRASISGSLPTFHYFVPNSSNRNSIPKKNMKVKGVFLCWNSPIPHPDDVSSCESLIPRYIMIESGGEDPFFVSSYNGGVIAVADGVSGWAEQNVGPSLFPQELMTNFSCLLDDEEVVATMVSGKDIHSIDVLLVN